MPKAQKTLYLLFCCHFLHWCTFVACNDVHCDCSQIHTHTGSLHHTIDVFCTEKVRTCFVVAVLQNTPCVLFVFHGQFVLFRHFRFVHVGFKFECCPVHGAVPLSLGLDAFCVRRLHLFHSEMMVLVDSFCSSSCSVSSVVSVQCDPFVGCSTCSLL